MKTAVEWLEDQIKWRTDITDIIAEAKEMEKENTINFAIQYMFGRTDIGSNLRNDFIQKYNETFKSE
jgi:hypothetical protein